MKKHTVDLRKKTVKELEKERKNIITEIEKLRIDWAVNKPKNTNVIANKHKRLSVLQTVLGEKKELEKIAPLRSSHSALQATRDKEELRGVKEK